MSANSSRARNQTATKPSRRFGTTTVECRVSHVRKYASAEEHAAKKNSKRPSAILVLRSKYGIWTSVHGSHILLWKYHGNVVFLQRAIVVEAHRRRAASASLI